MVYSIQMVEANNTSFINLFINKTLSVRFYGIFNFTRLESIGFIAKMRGKRVGSDDDDAA